MRAVAILDKVCDVRMKEANTRQKRVFVGRCGQVTEGGDGEGID
jgi:hypothetical protein